jgi:hypothetical protein
MGPGRPQFEPTREQRWLVLVLRAHGISHDTIARNLTPDGGISVPTLKRAFKQELAGGYEHVKASMIAALVRAGAQGNVGAIKYWLATHGGQEWRMPHNDSDAPTVNVNGGSATIIVKGGLPDTLFPDEEETEGDRVNGTGNGADHTA